MSTTTLVKRWTAEELAAHWGIACDRGFWQIIDDRDVPFIYLGQGTPMKGRRGQRGKYRFNPERIAAWERSQEQSFGKPANPDAPGPASITIAQVHDGKIRGGRKGKTKRGLQSQ